MKKLLNILKIKYLLYSLITLLACKQPLDYRACFIPSATNVKVRQELTFTNCSDFDGGFNDCTWYFGDGETRSSIGSMTVIHKYIEPGNYKVRLVIGEKDNLSEKIETITVTN